MTTVDQWFAVLRRSTESLPLRMRWGSNDGVGRAGVGGLSTSGGDLRGPGVSLGRILQGPSIEPFLGGVSSEGCMDAPLGKEEKWDFWNQRIEGVPKIHCLPCTW